MLLWIIGFTSLNGSYSCLQGYTKIYGNLCLKANETVMNAIYSKPDYNVDYIMIGFGFFCLFLVVSVDLTLYR